MTYKYTNKQKLSLVHLYSSEIWFFNKVLTLSFISYLLQINNTKTWDNVPWLKVYNNAQLLNAIKV